MSSIKELKRLVLKDTKNKQDFRKMFLWVVISREVGKKIESHMANSKIERYYISVQPQPITSNPIQTLHEFANIVLLTHQPYMNAIHNTCWHKSSV